MYKIFLKYRQTENFFLKKISEARKKGIVKLVDKKDFS